jgi:hypothetical protein
MAWTTILWFIPSPHPEQAVLGIFLERRYFDVNSDDAYFIYQASNSQPLRARGSFLRIFSKVPKRSGWVGKSPQIPRK